MMDSLTEQSINTYTEAKGYLKTLENSLLRKSKFNNDLLYNIVTLCTEKLFMSLLSHYRLNATHHTPMALYNETDKIKKLPEDFRDTIRLISRFESICQFDAFGYKTPTDDELNKMISGLSLINAYVKREISLEIQPGFLKN
jgi:hypothetical protein